MPDALQPLLATPETSALVFDVDGTLAPIVSRPELARVPDETADLLAALRDRYRLVACVSGRTSSGAEQLVGVPGIRYVGNHGIELHPDAPRAAEAVARFRDELGARWEVEDKRFSLALHFRGSPDELEAARNLRRVARQATERGLRPRWGRKVLEIRPDLDADKGTALTALLGGGGFTAALYAGDDETDRDAFRALRKLDLEHTVGIAVLSDETPGGLAGEADLCVDGPQALVPVMSRLADTGGPGRA